MDNFPFEEEKKNIKYWMKEHQSGLYLTVIFHLIVLILLTIQGIQGQLNNQTVFVFDFSRQEAEEARKEEEIKEQQIKEEVEREVEEMIQRAIAQNMPRNVAVNTEDLKTQEIKSTLGESKSIIEEVKAVQARLEATRQQIEDMQGADEIPMGNNTEEEDKPTKVETYKGPSVLSYTLEGRRAVSLPIPVYKCPGGGDVTVIIYVNKQGYVVDAVINKNESANNDCLHDAALNAAKRSRFNHNPNAPDRQEGQIVYRFIAQ